MDFFGQRVGFVKLKFSSGWALGFCSKDFYSPIIALCSESGVTSDAAVSKGLKSHTRY